MIGLVLSANLSHEDMLTRTYRVPYKDVASSREHLALLARR